MGGSVSSGQNNDELIDNLVEGSLIKTNNIERVFRCIDRGLFFLPDFKERAYRDLAWREGYLHISAPCVYSKVMENLELKEGLTFLNIGSGTGYLSSMAGLILGSNGVNHNIEIHDEIIKHAKIKIDELIKNSVYFDEFDFCEPTFVHGNCMNLIVNSQTMLYDRIYVGACCNQDQENFITTLLKKDGILIMPANDSLVKIKKLDDKWTTKNTIMNVSFASLITSQIERSHADESFSMPRLEPLSLQELCRFKIRKTIRESISSEFPTYYDVKREKSTFNKEKSVQKTKSLDIEDNEDDDFSDENNDFPLTRFERIFSPEFPINGNEGTENNFESQLRLMIYGHLLDAATNSLQAAVNASNTDNESDNEVPIHENVQIDSRSSSMSSETFRSFLNDFNISSYSENEENDTDDSDLFDLFAENCRRANSQNMNGQARSSNEDSDEQFLDIPTSSKSDSLTNISSENDLANELEDGPNENPIPFQKSSTERMPIIKRKRNTSSGYSTSSTDFNTSLTEIVEDTENNISENKTKEMIEDEEKQELLTNIKKFEKKFEDYSQVTNGRVVKMNLLRQRVMKLHISTALKNFLIYYRKI